MYSVSRGKFHLGRSFSHWVLAIIHSSIDLDNVLWRAPYEVGKKMSATAMHIKYYLAYAGYLDFVAVNT